MADDALTGEMHQRPCRVQFGGNVEPPVDRVAGRFTVGVGENGLDYRLKRLQRGAHSDRIGGTQRIDRVEHFVYRDVFPPTIAGQVEAPILPGALGGCPPSRSQVHPNEEKLVLGVRLVVLASELPGGQKIGGDVARFLTLGVGVGRRQAQLEERIDGQRAATRSLEPTARLRTDFGEGFNCVTPLCVVEAVQRLPE